MNNITTNPVQPTTTNAQWSKPEFEEIILSCEISSYSMAILPDDVLI